MLDLKKLFKSFSFSFEGLKFLFKKEQNIRVHCFISLAVLLLAFILKLTSVEWIVVLLCIALVISAEIFNTAIEKTIDYISLEKHPLAKNIKDISAAAVVFLAFISVVIGLIIFLPKLINLF